MTMELTTQVVPNKQSHLADDLRFQEQEASSEEEEVPTKRAGVDASLAQEEPTEQDQDRGNQHDGQG